MPTVDGEQGRHRSHRFSVMGDPQMLRSAVRVSAERISPTRVAVTIAPTGAGHSFPTGDMFRRLEARAEAVDGRGNTRGRAEPVVLGRTFIDAPRGETELGFQRVESEDKRVPPPGAGTPGRLVFELPPSARGLPVRWHLAYQRMGTPMAEAFRVSQVLDEVMIAEGEVVP
jgi:hypothetical protein